MHFVNRAGYTTYIHRSWIVDVEPDDQSPGQYVLVLSDNDLYELADEADARNVATLLEERQRLELRGLDYRRDVAVK